MATAIPTRLIRSLESPFDAFGIGSSASEPDPTGLLREDTFKEDRGRLMDRLNTLNKAGIWTGLIALLLVVADEGANAYRRCMEVNR